jgi:hypothetical protein
MDFYAAHLDKKTLCHSFGAVSREGVRDFMAHNHRQAGLRPGDRQHAGIDNDLPSGHSPGVDVGVLNQIEFPRIRFQFVFYAFLGAIPLYGLLNSAADTPYLPVISTCEQEGSNNKARLKITNLGMVRVFIANLLNFDLQTVYTLAAHNLVFKLFLNLPLKRTGLADNLG